MNKTKEFIYNLITPGETLSQKVVKDGFWVFFLRIVNRGFSLIRLIILARILSPNDFGLMGIALLTMSTLETFSKIGFQQTLIQKKEDIKSYLDSAWTVLILRGFILFAILYFIEPHKTPDSCLDTEISERNLCKRSKRIYGENTLAYPRT